MLAPTVQYFIQPLQILLNFLAYLHPILFLLKYSMKKIALELQKALVIIMDWFLEFLLLGKCKKIRIQESHHFYVYVVLFCRNCHINSGKKNEIFPLPYLEFFENVFPDFYRGYCHVCCHRFCRKYSDMAYKRNE